MKTTDSRILSLELELEDLRKKYVEADEFAQATIRAEAELLKAQLRALYIAKNKEKSPYKQFRCDHFDTKKKVFDDGTRVCVDCNTMLFVGTEVKE